jgi:hypothetical protein
MLNFTVVHGFNKLSFSFDDPSLTTLENVSNQIEQQTGVPKQGQRLIHKVEDKHLLTLLLVYQVYPPLFSYTL